MTSSAPNAVTYNGNGNTGGTAPVDHRAPTSPAPRSRSSANSGSLVKTGYSFSGWNTAANGSGTSYAAGQHLHHAPAT